MYTLITPLFCASIAQLGTWLGKKPNLEFPLYVPPLSLLNICTVGP